MLARRWRVVGRRVRRRGGLADRLRKRVRRARRARNGESQGVAVGVWSGAVGAVLPDPQVEPGLMCVTNLSAVTTGSVSPRRRQLPRRLRLRLRRERRLAAGTTGKLTGPSGTDFNHHLPFRGASGLGSILVDATVSTVGLVVGSDCA